MDCRDQVKPLKDFQELKNVDIVKDLPRASIRNPAARGCKFSIVRDGSELKLEKVPKSQLSSKTLVCHDMKGGYLEDKFNNGCFDLPEEPYTFIHWSLIDTFVYFSHHFITIPPLGWIEAGHKNGVKILGTIITEFDPGSMICKEILENRENVDLFVSKCVEIAQSVGFDGWLLNIENPIEKDHIGNLLYLVQKLTQSMHEALPNSEVIWYDSVTINGELKWQNQLNELNAPYFDICDGIFLNYNWTEEGLSSSVLFNFERCFDIYVGIDVFGRGCPGGGGFDSNKALTMIKYHSLSTAIFAPGWTHECSSDQDKFENRDQKFWNLLEPLLYHQGLTMTSVPEQDLNPGSGSGSGPEQDLNPGSGIKNDKCWWIDLCKQSAFPSRNNKDKYEMSCDIPAKSMTICVRLTQDVPLDSICLKLIFDEQKPVIIKEATRMEKNLKYLFEIEPPKDSQYLHFVQIVSNLCKNIQSLSIN